VTDPQRGRIVAAFERELTRSPLPPELRSQAVRGAVGKRYEPSHTRQQWALALVATVVAVAIVATLVLGTRTLRTVPAKVGPPPTPRAGASVAFDEARGQMVLFGGNTGTVAALDETWTFDGKGWTQHHSAINPPGRQGAAMAYDSARQRIVLVGGTGTTRTQVELRDTWTWDGQSWREEHPSQLPATQELVLSFDPVSRMVIGFYADPVAGGKSHTIAWNGTDWQELHPGTQPQTSAGASLVSDGSRLLFIARPFAPEGGRYFSQTWSWDGREWHRLNPRVNLPGGASIAVFDKATGQVIALNGETWAWDGVMWTRQHPLSSPTGAPYLAYFPSLKKVIAWGDQYSNQSGDLWAWEGSNWTKLRAGPPIPTPSGKGWHLQGNMSPADADAAIRKTVNAVHPVLLPSWLPADMEAQVMAGSDGFTIAYMSDQRDKRISLVIVIPNPPSGGEHGEGGPVKFHGITAQYGVNDSTSPLSQRWLMWNEPGSMPNSGPKLSGIPYFLSTDGLTEQEFWQVANSLR
jgi:hypothetical protein